MFTFQQGGAAMVELTPAGSLAAVGHPGRRRRVALDTVLVGIIREGRPIAPTPDDALEGRDQLLLLTVQDSEEDLRELLAPRAGSGPSAPQG